MDSTFEGLKARQRVERDSHPNNLGLRVHRALSCLHRAEQEGDPYSRLIFLWITFNTAYATDIDDREGLSEQRIFYVFPEKLQALDRNHCLNELVWSAHLAPFEYYSITIMCSPASWATRKATRPKISGSKLFAAPKAANHALARQSPLCLLAHRTQPHYALRNQLVHGGATWNSSINRDQGRDCVNLMGELVPTVIEIMMDSSNIMWGEANYPVVTN